MDWKAVMLTRENCTKPESESEPENLLTVGKKQVVVNTAKNKLQLTCDIDDVLTYAIVHNGAHIVRDICVKNISESDLDD